MHTLQCLPLVRNKHCSSSITTTPVSVLDLEQNRLRIGQWFHAEPHDQLLNPYAGQHLF